MPLIFYICKPQPARSILGPFFYFRVDIFAPYLLQLHQAGRAVFFFFYERLLSPPPFSPTLLIHLFIVQLQLFFAAVWFYPSPPTLSTITTAYFPIEMLPFLPRPLHRVSFFYQRCPPPFSLSPARCPSYFLAYDIISPSVCHMSLFEPPTTTTTLHPAPTQNFNATPSLRFCKRPPALPPRD